MNKTLERIIIYTTIIASAINGGCTSTSKTTSESSKGTTVAKIGQIRDSNIKVKKVIYRRPAPVKELMSSIDNYQDFLEFRENYGGYGDRIVDYLKQNEFGNADAIVNNLAEKLKDDTNPYAQQYLEQVKSFSYTIYNVKEVVQETTKSELEDPAAVVLTSPVIAVFGGTLLAMETLVAPVDLLMGEEPYRMSREGWEESFKKTKKKDIINKTIDVIEVNPYSGSRTIIEKDMPYSSILYRSRRLK